MLRKLILSATIAVSSVVPFFAHAAYEISDGSVKALYHLESTSDSSGNGYNLTNNNSVTFGTGKLSNAQDTGTSNANGSGTYTSYKNLYTTSLHHDQSTTWSASFWFNANTLQNSASFGDGNAIFSLGYRTDSNTIDVRVTNQQIGCEYTGINAGNSYSATKSQTFSTGTWYHVVCTYDKTNTTLGLYLNGTLASTSSLSYAGGVGSAAGFNALALDSFLVNSSDGYSVRNADVKIDEFVLTTKVLSATDVTYLYNSGTGNEVCVSVGCAPLPTTPTSEVETFVARYQSALIWIGGAVLALAVGLAFRNIGVVFYEHYKKQRY